MYIIIDKSKINREKPRVKIISHQKHVKNWKNIIWTCFDSKFDNETLKYKVIIEENGENITKRKGPEIHLKFIWDMDTEIRYVPDRIISYTSSTGVILTVDLAV